MIIEQNIIEKPIFSVVIPVYKEEKILDSTLQKYTPEIRKKYSLEIIVSDGGSKDKTVEIAKKYADKIVIHTEDRRQTIAEGRNAGAAEARGDIIVLINGDTYPENVEQFFGFIYDYYKNGKFESNPALATRVYVAPEELGVSDWLFYNGFNFYVRMLNIIGLGMCRGECQIIRRDIFEKVGGYNPTLAAGEDFDLFMRIAKIVKTKYTSKITVIESPRRFRKTGYLRVIYRWTMNGLKVMLSGKAADDEWEAIR